MSNIKLIKEERLPDIIATKDGLIERMTGRKIESPLDFDYKAAYWEMREVFDDSCVRNAMIFSAKNPEIVYGKNTNEYKRVNQGFFDLYFSIVRSNSEEEQT